MRVLSAAPAINVKPVIGGVEIAVRYITRANERYQLRAKLYQTAVVQSCTAGYDALGRCLITQCARSPAPRIDLQSLPPVALVLTPQDVNRARFYSE
jgi:hypothetical protein